MSRLPDAPRGGAEPVPPRRLSQEQFELVIRRAAELQARAAEEGGASELTEEEALRIGRELGLSATNLARALAEVRGRAVEEHGLSVGLMGPALLRASRVVRGDTASVARHLESYLLEHEYLTVQRRFPDRTVYVRASGVAAALGRTARDVFGRSPLLRVGTLEVGVQPLEEGSCLVTLAADLGEQRLGFLVGGLGAGGMGGGAVAAVLGVAIAPPAALLGVPVAAGVYLGSRLGYSRRARRVQTQLESLLDRLEHGELPRLRTLPRWQNWRG